MVEGNHRQAIKRLAALFRANQQSRPVMLLGAGASYRSGVPLADKLVQDIARHAFAVLELGNENLVSRVSPSDWKPFLEAQSWFLKPPAPLAENFPLAVQHFLHPQEVRRRVLTHAIRPQQAIKRGSGLPDVHELMPQHGGRATFSCGSENSFVTISLQQAEQKQPRAGVAVRRSDTDVFITNLLPFTKLPANLLIMPLHDNTVRKLWFDSDEERASVPLSLAVDGQMISLGDFRNTPAFADRNGKLAEARAIPLAEVAANDVYHRYFVRLVGTHWSFFLDQFKVDGLENDYKRKRAFFCLQSGDANTISYSSRLGRAVSRDVVKRRGDNGQEHENEGFYYATVNMGGNWALQIKPMYVFTDRTGRFPLPPRLQTSRATRRFKFDRNKSVDDDLTFWTRYLGRTNAAVNLGRGWDDDLLLEFTLASVELPVASFAPEA